MSTFLNNSLFFKNKNILSKKVGKKVEKVEKWIFFQKKWKKSEKWKKVEKVDDLTPCTRYTEIDNGSLLIDMINNN